MSLNTRKTERIWIRIDEKLKNFLVSYALKNKTTVSFLLRKIIIMFINKKISRKELNKEIKEYLREKKFLQGLYETKVYMRYVYQLTNVLRHIKTVGLSTRKAGYDVNTDLIKNIIRRYCKLFRYFPVEIKNVMKNEFISLANFGNREEILKLINSYDKDDTGRIWYKRK